MFLKPVSKRTPFRNPFERYKRVKGAKWKKKDFIFINEDGIYVVQLHKVECESPKWASEEDKRVMTKFCQTKSTITCLPFVTCNSLFTIKIVIYATSTKHYFLYKWEEYTYDRSECNLTCKRVLYAHVAYLIFLQHHFLCKIKRK
jgi:hypothetical protein